MTKQYRKGPIGALMDEYERSAQELVGVLSSISADVYDKILDPATQDENCRSIQTMASHVVSSGYSYANSIRKQLAMDSISYKKTLIPHHLIENEMHRMMTYTVATLDGRWEMTEEEIMAVIIDSSWGVRYDMEQLLEHAIVHVLRHRRQIQRFLT